MKTIIGIIILVFLHVKAHEEAFVESIKYQIYEIIKNPAVDLGTIHNDVEEVITNEVNAMGEDIRTRLVETANQLNTQIGNVRAHTKIRQDIDTLLGEQLDHEIKKYGSCEPEIIKDIVDTVINKVNEDDNDRTEIINNLTYEGNLATHSHSLWIPMHYYFEVLFSRFVHLMLEILEKHKVPVVDYIAPFTEMEEPSIDFDAIIRSTDGRRKINLELTLGPIRRDLNFMMKNLEGQTAKAIQSLEMLLGHDVERLTRGSKRLNANEVVEPLNSSNEIRVNAMRARIEHEFAANTVHARNLPINKHKVFGDIKRCYDRTAMDIILMYWEIDREILLASSRILTGEKPFGSVHYKPETEIIIESPYHTP